MCATLGCSGYGKRENEPVPPGFGLEKDRLWGVFLRLVAALVALLIAVASRLERVVSHHTTVFDTACRVTLWAIDGAESRGLETGTRPGMTSWVGGPSG